MTATAPTPLTLIVEGKPLVFDVPVPVGEVIPAGSWYCAFSPDGAPILEINAVDYTVRGSYKWFLPRPPVAPESFADGDVAWVRVERGRTGIWWDPDGTTVLDEDDDLVGWLARGDAFTTTPHRPESLADVLDAFGDRLTEAERTSIVAAAKGEAS